MQVHVAMQGLELLDDHAAVPMHDRLGKSRRTRRKENPQRELEWHLLELESLGGHGWLVQQVVPEDRVRGRWRVIFAIEIGQVYDVLDRLELHQELAHIRPAIESLARVLIAIDTEEHLRCELRETVEHAARTEVRPAARPDCTNAGGGQHGDDGLGSIRQVRGNAIARLETEPPQFCRQDAHLRTELGPGQLREWRALTQMQQGFGAWALIAQDVLSKVNARARKPVGARHLAAGQHALVRL